MAAESNARLSSASVDFLQAYQKDDPFHVVAQQMIVFSGTYPATVAIAMDSHLVLRNFRACLYVYNGYMQHAKANSGGKAGVPAYRPSTAGPPVAIPVYTGTYVPRKPSVLATTWASVWTKCTPRNILMGLGVLALAAVVVFAVYHIPYARCGAAIGWFFSPPHLIEVRDGDKTVSVTHGGLAAFIKSMPALLELKNRINTSVVYCQNVVNWIRGEAGNSENRGILVEINENRLACAGVTSAFRHYKQRGRQISAIKLQQIRRNISDTFKKNRGYSMDVLPLTLPVVQRAPVLTTQISESFLYQDLLDTQAREFAAFKTAYAQTCKAATDDKETAATKVQALESQLANYRNATDATLKSLQGAQDATLKSLQDTQDAWLGWAMTGVVVGVLATTVVVVLSNSVVLVTLAHSGGLGAMIARPIVDCLTRLGFKSVIHAAALGAKQATSAAASAAAAGAAAAAARTSAVEAKGFFDKAAELFDVAAELFAKMGPGSLASV